MLSFARNPLCLFRRPRRSTKSAGAKQFLHTSAIAKYPREASAEQQAIIADIETNNVVVSARPGTGKTATAEFVVQKYPTASVAVVTYSKRLQLETQARLGRSSSAEAYTFHRLAGQMFNKGVQNDSLMQALRDQKLPPSMARMPQRCDILILDELQDMTETLYWLTCQYLASITHLQGYAPRILVLGDARQAIYEFRHADSRYLEYAASLLSAGNSYPWRSRTLSKSFRISQENASLINDGFLGGEQYIEGVFSTGLKPIYAHVNSKYTHTLISLLLPLIRKHGPENSAILVPSIRNNSRVQQLVNSLSKQHGIQVAVSMGDDIPLDLDVIRRKLVLSTYHQFKGSERDMVTVVGADESYFRRIARALPDHRCPNPTFVAITRARQQLVILQEQNQAAMPFVNMAAIDEACIVVNLLSSGKAPRQQRKPGSPTQVGLVLPSAANARNVVRHVPDEVLDSLLRQHAQITRQPGSWIINAPDKICTDSNLDLYEAVSDWNGLAVTAAFEWRLRRKLRTFGMDDDPRIPKEKKERIAWFTREAAAYEAKQSGYIPRRVQTQGHPFDWLLPHLDAATARLRAKLAAELAFVPSTYLEFERFLSHDVRLQGNISRDDPHQRIKLDGKVDILQTQFDGDAVGRTTQIWEIKFVSALTLEHAAQAIVYAYLWSVQKDNLNLPCPSIILYNIRDGATWKLRSTAEDVKAVVEGILRAKYTAQAKTPLDHFISRSAEVRQEVQDVMALRDVHTREVAYPGGGGKSYGEPLTSSGSGRAYGENMFNDGF